MVAVTIMPYDEVLGLNTEQLVSLLYLTVLWLHKQLQFVGLKSDGFRKFGT
jgi:hypothetical protein